MSGVCGVSKTLCVSACGDTPFASAGQSRHHVPRVVTSAGQEPRPVTPGPEARSRALSETRFGKNFLRKSHHKSPARPVFSLKIFIVVSALCVVY